VNPNLRDTLRSLGLLVLRLGAGGLLLFGHGLPKLTHFSERAARFADPIGVGPGAGLALVIFAEVFCSLFVMLGLATRLAAIPPVIFFLIAALIHHAADPWAKKELALVYLVAFLTLILTGGGNYALDALFRRRRYRRGAGDSAGTG
jgi:putative oxidoreductase